MSISDAERDIHADDHSARSSAACGLSDLPQRSVLHSSGFMLGLARPEKKKKTLETDFPAISKIWQSEDNPVMFYNDIRKALDFIHAHPKCFNEALWSWARQFLDAVKQDMEDVNLSVLTFDTGSIIF